MNENENPEYKKDILNEWAESKESSFSSVSSIVSQTEKTDNSSFVDSVKDVEILKSILKDNLQKSEDEIKRCEDELETLQEKINVLENTVFTSKKNQRILRNRIREIEINDEIEFSEEEILQIRLKKNEFAKETQTFFYLNNKRYRFFEEFIIGRDKSCNLVLFDEVASRKHARIFKDKDDAFSICDLGSKNGIFINDVKIDYPIICKLKNNDTIRIGRHSFVFSLDGKSILPQNPEEENPVDEKKRSLVSIEIGKNRLSHLEYNDKKFELTEQTLTIGRSKNCDICVNDGLVSRNHASIRFLRGEYFLKDEGSTNGTYLNGKRVPPSVEGESKYVKLSVGDKISVGAAIIICF